MFKSFALGIEAFHSHKLPSLSMCEGCAFTSLGDHTFGAHRRFVSFTLPFFSNLFSLLNTKIETNRKLPVELKGNYMLHISYFRNISQPREKGRQVVYIFESYICSSHTNNNCALVEHVRPVGTCIKMTRGQVVHVGEEFDIVKDPLTISKSHTKHCDCHSAINYMSI